MPRPSARPARSALPDNTGRAGHTGRTGHVATPLTRLRFDELAVFVEVAEAGTLAGAARRLGVPKSTVGRAIARVEEDLGVSLVRRMARGPALTEPGRKLANLAAPHVAALRDVHAALHRDANDAYGLIRFTATPDLGTLVLGPLLQAFLTRYPRIRLEIDHTARVIDLVREGFDVALRVAQKLPSSALVAKKLGRLDLGLYASPLYLARRPAPKRPEDLPNHEHMLIDGTNARGGLTLEGPRGVLRVPLEARVMANDVPFIREAIIGGAGIGALPWFMANAEIAAGRLVRVLPEYRLAGTTAYLVHTPARPLPRKVEVFKAFLLEHAPRMLVES